MVQFGKILINPEDVSSIENNTLARRCIIYMKSGKSYGIDGYSMSDALEKLGGIIT